MVYKKGWLGAHQKKPKKKRHAAKPKGEKDSFTTRPLRNKREQWPTDHLYKGLDKRRSTRKKKKQQPANLRGGKDIEHKVPCYQL